MRRRVLPLLILLGALVVPAFGASPAHAHASVTATEPAAGATVNAVPRRVTLRLIKKQATRAGDPIQVFGPDGSRVDTGDVVVGDGGYVISVGINPSTRAGGTYNVLYQITSADTHIIQDRFTFTLIPPAGEVMSATGAGASAERTSPDHLRVIGPPAASILAAVATVAAFVTLVVMVRRRMRKRARPAAEPAFRVISTGEHRLGHAVAGISASSAVSVTPGTQPTGVT